jgi:hypothetical protein
MAKVESGYPTELVVIRAAATKQKDWGNQAWWPWNQTEKLTMRRCYVAWVDLNTVQYMTTIHIIDEMKTILHKDAKGRKGVPISVICDEPPSWNTIVTWVDQTEMLSNGHTIHLVASIVDTGGHFSSFCWMWPFWMHSNCGVVFTLISNFCILPRFQCPRPRTTSNTRMLERQRTLAN